MQNDGYPAILIDAGIEINSGSRWTYKQFVNRMRNLFFLRKLRFSQVRTGGDAFAASGRRNPANGVRTALSGTAGIEKGGEARTHPPSALLTAENEPRQCGRSRTAIVKGYFFGL